MAYSDSADEQDTIVDGENVIGAQRPKLTAEQLAAVAQMETEEYGSETQLSTLKTHDMQLITLPDGSTKLVPLEDLARYGYQRMKWPGQKGARASYPYDV